MSARETREMLLSDKMAEVQALQRNGAEENAPRDSKGRYMPRAITRPDNISPGEYGTSSRYRIARLKRDHPTIAEALIQSLML
jgi:hypothetical protein